MSGQDRIIDKSAWLKAETAWVAAKTGWSEDYAEECVVGYLHHSDFHKPLLAARDVYLANLGDEAIATLLLSLLASRRSRVLARVKAAVGEETAEGMSGK